MKKLFLFLAIIESANLCANARSNSEIIGHIRPETAGHTRSELKKHYDKYSDLVAKAKIITKSAIKNAVEITLENHNSLKEFAQGGSLASAIEFISAVAEGFCPVAIAAIVLPLIPYASAITIKNAASSMLDPESSDEMPFSCNIKSQNSFLAIYGD